MYLVCENNICIITTFSLATSVSSTKLFNLMSKSRRSFHWSPSIPTPTFLIASFSSNIFNPWGKTVTFYYYFHRLYQVRWIYFLLLTYYIFIFVFVFMLSQNSEIHSPWVFPFLPKAKSPDWLQEKQLLWMLPLLTLMVYFWSFAPLNSSSLPSKQE